MQTRPTILVVTGAAGCGKSSVAQFLAAELQIPFIEGDEFHPPSNIDKMSHGLPLTDADRWDWLELLRQTALRRLTAGARAVVLACSALKRRYRDVMRQAALDGASVHFIYLRTSEDLLLARVKARQGHYMKDDMVKSQVLALEEPVDEPDCMIVDAADETLEQVQFRVLRLVEALVD